MKYTIIDFGYFNSIFNECRGSYPDYLTNNIDFLRLKIHFHCDRMFVYDAKPDANGKILSEKMKGIVNSKFETEKLYAGKNSIFFKYGRLIEGKGELRQKGVDLLLSIDAINLARMPTTEAMTFVLGDQDFLPLLEELNKFPPKISIVGRIRTPITIRKMCDSFREFGLMDMLALNLFEKGKEPYCFCTNITPIPIIEELFSDKIQGFDVFRFRASEPYGGYSAVLLRTKGVGFRTIRDGMYYYSIHENEQIAKYFLIQQFG